MNTSAELALRVEGAATTSQSPGNVANFVGAILMREFVLGASVNAALASSLWMGPKPKWEHKKGRQPTLPLNCVISAATDICAMSEIDSEDALADVVQAIQSQFEVASECDEEDEAWVLDVLGDVLASAAAEARCALMEATAGYPKSGGSVARWVQLRMAIDLDE